MSLAETTPATVVGFLLHLQAKGRATSTISRMLASIKCYYHFLAGEEIIPRDPTINLDAPKQEKKLPRVLSVENVLRLLQRSEEHTSELQSRPHLVCRLL